MWYNLVNRGQPRFSKGVLLFKSGLTRELYKEFLDSYQLNRSELKSPPFFYVDLELKEVRLLTNLMRSSGGPDEVYAISIAGEGAVEVLSTEN